LLSLWEHLCVDKRDDPEARIRELERPLGEMAGASEWGAAPRARKTAGFRGWWIVLAVFVALAVAVPAGLAVVDAVGVLTAHRSSGGPKSTPGAPPTTSTSMTAQPNQSLQALYQVLPHGFDADRCSPIRSPNRHALATVECEAASDGSRPYAEFSLFPNATALADVFQIGVNEDTIAQCPNGNRPPTTWYTEAAPNVPAGTLFCGNYNGGPDLLWTNSRDLLQGDIQGPDLNALYQYWLTVTTAAK
jgi:serine/threonine-protein kinase